MGKSFPRPFFKAADVMSADSPRTAPPSCVRKIARCELRLKAVRSSRKVSSPTQGAAESDREEHANRHLKALAILHAFSDHDSQASSLRVWRPGGKHTGQHVAVWSWRRTQPLHRHRGVPEPERNCCSTTAFSDSRPQCTDMFEKSRLSWPVCWLCQQ